MFLCGVAIDTKLGYAFDKPAMRNLSDCRFFFLALSDEAESKRLSLEVLAVWSQGPWEDGKSG